MKADRIVVPEALRAVLLDEIYSALLGVTLSQNRTRERLFWPVMSSDIDAWLEVFSIFKEMQFNNPKEPLISTQAPSKPWTDLAADYVSLIVNITKLFWTISQDILRWNAYAITFHQPA